MATIHIIAEARVLPSISREGIISGVVEYERCIGIGFLPSLIQKCTPRYDILFALDNVTEEDEERLLRFFKKYQIEENKNWFVWSDEIYNFFLSHPTIEEIRPHLPQPLLTNEKQIMYYKDLITPIVNIMVENRIGVNEEVVVGKPNYLVASQLLDYLVREDQYFVNQGEFIEYLRPNLGEEKINFILQCLEEMKVVEKELEEFWKQSGYHNRMRYVCKLGKELDSGKFDLFLNSIPPSFKKYYITLGPERCGGAGYQRGVMEKRYIGLMSNQDIDIESEILKYFDVGQKWTYAQAKEKLKEIYDSVGYMKAPMASDLEEFFETKHYMIPDKETKKRAHGFKIIKLK